MTKRMVTKWHPSVGNATVPDASDLIVGDGAPLLHTSTADEDVQDVLAGWCIGWITLSRLLVAAQNAAVTFAIVNMRLTVGSAAAVQTFDPFDSDHLARQDILTMGSIPVPPVVLVPSTDSPIIDRQSVVVPVRCRVGRKVQRNTNNLFLWVASTDNVPPGVDNSFHIMWNIRTLMKFP